MSFEIEFTDEFRMWYEDVLDLAEQESVTHVVEMLEDVGPNLRYRHSLGVSGSKFSHMRELRVQHEGRPYRILYAFDPRRAALLLLGGDKTGDGRWYEKLSPKQMQSTSAISNTLGANDRRKHGDTLERDQA